MRVALEILTILVVSVAMALALAHALELPGKLRLTKAQYLAVQPIYYPGFTFGGFTEPLCVLLTFALMFLLPWGSVPFWLAAAALLALIAMHGCYWLLTHPVNKFWLKDFKLKDAGRGFFAFDPLRRQAESGAPDWRALRDRWEYSHLVRAGLGLVALTLLVTAVAL